MSNPLTHYSYSESTSPWSFSIVMRDLQRSKIYQLNSIWFDPGFENTIYRTRDEHADHYHTIVFYGEVRIAMPSSQRTIQVRGLKFVNDNRNSTNLKHNLLYKA